MEVPKRFPGLCAWLLLAASVAGQDASTFVDSGKQELAKQEFAAAAADFTRALELDPGLVDAWYGRGFSRLRQGQAALALPDLDRAIRLGPESGATYGVRGMALLALERWSDAVADLERALEIDPESVSHRLRLAVGRYCAGDWDQAQADFQRIPRERTLHRDYAELFLWIIRSRRGAAALADRLILSYVEGRPPGDSPGVAADNFDFLLGRISERDFLANRGQASMPEFLAGIRRLMENDREQASDFLRAARRDSGPATILNLVSLADLTLLMPPQPELSAGGHLWRGDGFLARGDPRAAVREYSLAAEKDPNCALAFDSRARAKRRLGDLAGAIEDFVRSAETNLRFWKRSVIGNPRLSPNDGRSWGQAVADLRSACGLPLMDEHIFRWAQDSWENFFIRDEYDRALLAYSAELGSRDAGHLRILLFLAGGMDRKEFLQSAGDGASTRFYLVLKDLLDRKREEALEHLRAALRFGLLESDPLFLAAAENGVQVRVPRTSLRPGGRITIREEKNRPEAPGSLRPIGKAWRIEVPMNRPMHGRAVVRIPLPVPPGADTVVLLGRHDGSRWSLVPARIEGGRAVGWVDHFSLFSLFARKRTEPPGAGVAGGFRTDPPVVIGVLMLGDLAWLLLDPAPCRIARAEESEGDADVFRIRLYGRVKDETQKSGSRFDPLKDEDGDIFVDPSGGVFWLSLDLESGPPPPVHATSAVTDLREYLRVAPLFSNGQEGKLSRTVTYPVGVARAYDQLRNGLQNKMTEEQSRDFLDAALRLSLLIQVSPSDSTGSPGGYMPGDTFVNSLTARVFSGRWGSFIRLQDNSGFSWVLAHEWGHYAAHLLLGEKFGRLPGGSHAGWKEASPSWRKPWQSGRSLAWGEDLATWLGQYGTGVGISPEAGAMAGRVLDFSRHPEGRDLSRLWPRNRDMDAVRVESISATVLSRITEEFGFDRVCEVIRRDVPVDAVEFFRAWNSGGKDKEELARFQGIYLDEGISWKVRGRIVAPPRKPGGLPIPLEDAEVRLVSRSGRPIGSLVKQTGEDGRFDMAIPPGTVLFSVTKKGWRQVAPFSFQADTRRETNSKAQGMDDFKMRPEAALLAYIPYRKQAAPLRIERVSLETAQRRPAVAIQGAYVRLSPEVAWSRDGLRLILNYAPDDQGSPERTGIIDLQEGRPIAILPRSDSKQVFSPDGGRIAFVRRKGPGSAMKTSLHVMDWDGSSAEPLTPYLDSSAFFLSSAISWSPGGSSLAVSAKYPSSGEESRNSLWLVDTQGMGRPRLLLRETQPLASPSWSHSGEQIAFLRVFDHALEVLPATGGRPETLASLERSSQIDEDVPPAWSPDDGMLAFAIRGGLAIVDRDTGAIQKAAALEQNEVIAGYTSRDYPVWSPDGRFVAYSTYYDASLWDPDHGRRKLYVYDTVTRRTLPIGKGYAPVWIPD
ncbi:MAG: tetratricopeptide repeat protein [Planctomycetota bacterium]